MIASVRTSAKNVLRSLDLVIMRESTYREGVINTQARDDLAFLLEMPGHQAPALLANLGRSKAQYRQDLFVLSELGFKRSGVFVEFGATNGADISNTHLLEKAFDWTGILAEPARRWHAGLRRNRTCRIVTDCVWTVTGATVDFLEAERAEVSTIATHVGADKWSKARRSGRTYPVKTVSLNDLVRQHCPSTIIDYLSIDTEGTELEILRAFDFDSHPVRIITVEHNFTSERQALFDLLSRRGFVRKFEAVSQCDDWYVNRKLLAP